MRLAVYVVLVRIVYVYKFCAGIGCQICLPEPLSPNMPTGVERYVWYVVIGGKIGVIFAHLLVKSAFEIHAFRIPVYPPVPYRGAGRYPRGVSYLGFRSQFIYCVVVGKNLVVSRHYKGSPRKFARAGGLCYVILNFRRLELVAFLHKLFGHRRKKRARGIGVFRVVYPKPRVFRPIRLDKRNFHSLLLKYKRHRGVRALFQPFESAGRCARKH